MASFLIGTHSNLISFQTDVESLLDAEKPEDFVGTPTKIAIIESGSLYYGIAYDGEHVWVAKWLPNEEVIIYDLLTKKVLPFEAPLKSVHQITYANGGLYICNTHYNGIVYKSLTTGEEHTYTLGGAFEHDYAHPNSLWVDGTRVYVLLHNKGFRASEIAALRHYTTGFDTGFRSEIRYRLPTRDSHNIRFDRSLLTFNASVDSRVTQMDFLTGNVLRSIPLGSSDYLKGMATVGDMMLVGGTEKVPEYERYDSTSVVNIFDYRRTGYKGAVDLGPVGCVNEIRRVPDVLFADEPQD